MPLETYSLSNFLADLRRITSETADEKTILSRVRPLAKKAALDRSWLSHDHYKADPEQGFGSNLLHVETDNSLFIVAVSWLPGRGTPRSRPQKRKGSREKEEEGVKYHIDTLRST